MSDDCNQRLFSRTFLIEWAWEWDLHTSTYIHWGNILHHKNVWFEIVWQFLELRFNVIAFCSWKESNTNKMFIPSFCNMIFFPKKKISFHVIGETTVIFTEHLTMHFQRTIAKGPLRLPLLPFLIFKTVIFTSICRRQSFSDWLNFAFWLQF